MSDDELTPEQEAEVSRLLADSTVPVRMPDEVAARLDLVLAGLVAAPREQTPDRSRRRWPAVLVAAAAVSLFGYVGGQFLVQTRSSDDASSGAEVSSDDGQPESQQAPNGTDSAGPGGAPTDPPPAAGTPQRETPLYGASGNIDEDRTATALKRLSVVDLSGLLTFDLPGETRPKSLGASGCAWPATSPDARSFLVDLGEGGRGVVVVRPLGDGPLVAAVYPCKQSLFPVATTLVLRAR